MKKITLLFFILGIILNVNAQLQNANWYFGSYAGLNISTETSLVLESPMYAPNASASVSDESGNLLFYTNGVDVYNKNHLLMPNGNGTLNGDVEASTVLIAPTPNDSNKYYIFTVNADYTQSIGLNYSIVDMALDAGNGDVLTLNTNLLPYTSEKMAITKTSDGLAYWLVVFAPSTDPSIIDTFYSYKIDEYGINLVNQSTFSIFDRIVYNREGQMKISPDNANIAMAHNFSKLTSSPTEVSYCLWTSDFDETTGVVSNLATLYSFIGSNQYYGVEFSPDSNLLYASESENITNEKKIYQYQYRVSNVGYVVHSTPSTYSTPIYAIQRGIDDKLYVATDFNHLAVINNPNGLNENCNFTLDAVSFEHLRLGGVIKGLPQYVPDAILSLPPPPIKSNNNPIVLGNPIKDDLKIKFDDVQVYTVEIYNSVSNTIDAPEPIKTVIYEDMKNKKVYHINVSDLPSDTYYLVIRDENQNVWHETVIKIE